MKGINKVQALVLLASLLYSAFANPSLVFADAPRRGDECTLNSQLLRAYPSTWDPYVWNWKWNGEGWPVTEDEYSYVHWDTDGLVVMQCEDHGGFDDIFLATNFDQTSAQGLIEVDLATTWNLWLEACIQNINGTTDTPIASWTGAKFDIWAFEKGTDRKIMMEMYFWRTGANTVWVVDLPRQTNPGSNVWNYLVALDWMRYLYGNGYNIEWDENERHYFCINVYGLLERAVSRLNEEMEPNPPFDIANFRLGKVILCCESGNIGGLFGGPWVHVEMNSLRARYYTADTNGDGKVDMRDISFIARRYGVIFGDPDYDFRADLNTDGKIDMKDISFAAIRFGMSY